MPLTSLWPEFPVDRPVEFLKEAGPEALFLQGDAYLAPHRFCGLLALSWAT